MPYPSHITQESHENIGVDVFHDEIAYIFNSAQLTIRELPSSHRCVVSRISDFGG